MSVANGCDLFFFFKQKPAYEFYYGLGGAERCIKASLEARHADTLAHLTALSDGPMRLLIAARIGSTRPVSYTHPTLPTSDLA